MLAYPHFAVDNLFLWNGYRTFSSPEGPCYEYDDEEALEDCVRRVLARIPRRLNGRALRFLRRGLRLTQEQLGQLIERDSQTVARMEKSTSQIPVTVDLLVRGHYFNQTSPNTSVRELMELLSESGSLPAKIVLSHLPNGSWTHVFIMETMRLETVDVEATDFSVASGFAELPVSLSWMNPYGQFHSGTFTWPTDHEISVTAVTIGSDATFEQASVSVSRNTRPHLEDLTPHLSEFWSRSESVDSFTTNSFHYDPSDIEAGNATRH